MTKPQTYEVQQGQILSIKRIKNSYMGNGRYELIISTPNGTVRANTASNQMFNYQIGNKGLSTGDWVTFTQNGRGTINTLKPQDDTKTEEN